MANAPLGEVSKTDGAVDSPRAEQITRHSRRDPIGHPESGNIDVMPSSISSIACRDGNNH